VTESKEKVVTALKLFFAVVITKTGDLAGQGMDETDINRTLNGILIIPITKIINALGWVHLEDDFKNRVTLLHLATWFSSSAMLRSFDFPLP